MKMATVPKLWPNSTIAILASGPSLTPEDVGYVRGKARVIVVNTTYQIAPWADVMYACDAKVWKWHKGAPEFTGLKYALTAESRRWAPTVQVLKATGLDGLELEPHGLKTGRNSGYQCIGLSFHLGAKQILLLGFDMKRGRNGGTHWHGDHPHQGGMPFSSYLKHFPTLVKPLRENNVEVLNCTPGSALGCFPKANLREVLQ